MSRTTHTGLVVRKHNDDLIASVCIDYSSQKRYAEALIKCSGAQASFYKPGDYIEIQCDLAEPIDGMLTLQAHFITHIERRDLKPLEVQLELDEDEADLSAGQLKLMQRIAKQAAREVMANE